MEKTNLILDDESIIELKHELQQEQPVEKIKKPRAKRVVNEKTLEALKKGREKLAEKWKNDKIVNEELKEKYVIKKANKVIKNKLKIKEQVGAIELDSEDEEPIKIVQQKNRKKTSYCITSRIRFRRRNNYKKESRKKVTKELPDPSFDNNNVKPKILFY